MGRVRGFSVAFAEAVLDAGCAVATTGKTMTTAIGPKRRMSDGKEESSWRECARNIGGDVVIAQCRSWYELPFCFDRNALQWHNPRM